MKKLSNIFILSMTTLLIFTWASMALAVGVPATAVVNERIFDDCSTSILTVDNSYPHISIIDVKNNCDPGTFNRHNWRFSDDGATNKLFANEDGMRFSATMEVSGVGDGDAGLQLSPWWDQNTSGKFMVRTTDGDVACFGGRLPFYSFTINHGLTYTKGEPIFMEITYMPNGLNEMSPGTIEYRVDYMGSSYSSGPLEMDEGNPAEDPPHGLWGILNEATAGGYIQLAISEGPDDADFAVQWIDIMFEDLGGPVPNDEISFGGVKALFR